MASISSDALQDIIAAKQEPVLLGRFCQRGVLSGQS